MNLKQRVEKLESQLGAPHHVPKRPLPEWLQEIYETDGYVFDRWGRVVSVPSEPGKEQPEGSATAHEEAS